MARTIGPTVEILMRRVQQEGAVAVDPDFAVEIYGRCEQVVNVALQRVIASDTLTIPRQKLLFNFRDEFSDAIDIIRLSQSSRQLYRCAHLYEFANYEKNWFRNITGTQLEAWTQIGRDILIIYPGLAAASSADIDYVKKITVYTDFSGAYNETSELPDEDVDMALGLAEIVLLLRFRQLAKIPTRFKKLLETAKSKGLILNEPG